MKDKSHFPQETIFWSEMFLNLIFQMRNFLVFLTLKGDGQNQQCLLSYRDEHGTLLRQQTQPTIHSGQPDIEGGSTLVDRSTESESKSLESHRHSANFPPTSPSPTTLPTVRDRGLPHRAGASTPYSKESSGSEDKPGNTKSAATQRGKQPDFVDNVGLNKGSTERHDSQNFKKDDISGGESVRSPAELGQGDVDTDQTGSYDGVNDTKKEVRQSKKSSNHGQMTSANQKQTGNEKEADKKADGAWTGKNRRLTPSKQSTSSENVTENSQKPKVQPPFNSKSQKGVGTKSAEVGNVKLFAKLATTI